MFGLGSNDKNTIPSLFSDSNQNLYSVKNLGNAAHNSFQGFLKLVNHISTVGKPKHVITYDGVNEIISLENSLKSEITHAYEKLFYDIISKNNSFESFSHS